MKYTKTLMTHRSTWNATFSALIAVSACTALSAVLVGNLAARMLLTQETAPPPDSNPATESAGPDEKWRQDLLQNLDDQLRNMKDLERNANQSKDSALLSDIQSFRTSVDGHKSCVQNASTQDALQACNDAMQSTWDASSKLWTKSDLASRQRELKDMERQIKDAEREKIDVSKAKSVLEQYRIALANVQSLLQSGAENRDVQDAIQDTAQPLQQEFYNTINATRRQGEAARFRNEQLKNMERDIKNIERNKGDVTQLRAIMENVKAALALAEQLLQSGTADSRDIDDAFTALYDTQQRFQDLQNTANKVSDIARWKKEQLPNMERQLKAVKRNKGDTSALEAIIASIKASLDQADALVKSGGDPRDLDTLFQDEIYAKEQEFWALQNVMHTAAELQRWGKKGGELDNMAREIKRLKKDGADVSALETLWNQMKEKIAQAQGLTGQELQDVTQEAQELQQEFWNTVSNASASTDIKRWTKKGGEIDNMAREIKRLTREKTDTTELQNILDRMRQAIAEIQGLPQEEQRDAMQNVNDLQQEFWDTMNTLNRKSELQQWTRKGGHLAKMQKIVDVLKKKGKDVSAVESVLQEIRATVATLEQSADRDTLEEGRFALDDLRRQFEETIRPFMKKKSKGFPFPMKRG